MTQRDRDISGNPNSGETAHGVMSAILNYRLTRRSFGRLVVGGVAAEIARQAVVNSQQVEAAPVCDFPKREVVNAEFKVRAVWHFDGMGPDGKFHKAGDPVPDGTEIVIFPNPEIISLDEAKRQGKSVAGVIYGTEIAVLEGVEGQSMVRFVQSTIAHEIPRRLSARPNARVKSEACQTERDGLLLIGYNVIGTQVINGVEYKILTNDPINKNRAGKPLMVSDESDVTFSQFDILIQPFPEVQPTPTPTPFPTPEVKPTPVPPAIPAPVQDRPRGGLAPTGGEGTDETWFCVGANIAQGREPSSICPDGVEFPRPNR